MPFIRSSAGPRTQRHERALRSRKDDEVLHPGEPSLIGGVDVYLLGSAMGPRRRTSDVSPPAELASPPRLEVMILLGISGSRTSSLAHAPAVTLVADDHPS